MRYVNLYNLRVPAVWIRKAEKANEKLSKTPPENRSKFINDHARIWQELKEKLAELSHNKCWYCEIRYTRADFQIDHFRPKNKIKNYGNPEIEEEGYWWLAFDHNNFRLACSYCNSSHHCRDGKTRGKQNFFPLSEGSRRCNVGEDLEIERPQILDPTDPLDPLLLWFLDDGRVVPKHSHKQASEPRKIRAEITIDILNLNAFLTREKRRRLKNDCDFLVKQGDKAIKATEDGSENQEQALRDVARQIMNLIEESAELSSAAKVYLKSSNRPWLNEFLERV